MLCYVSRQHLNKLQRMAMEMKTRNKLIRTIKATILFGIEVDPEGYTF